MASELILPNIPFCVTQPDFVGMDDGLDVGCTDGKADGLVDGVIVGLVDDVIVGVADGMGLGYPVALKRGRKR